MRRRRATGAAVEGAAGDTGRRGPAGSSSEAGAACRDLAETCRRTGAAFHAAHAVRAAAVGCVPSATAAGDR